MGQGSRDSTVGGGGHRRGLPSESSRTRTLAPAIPTRDSWHPPGQRCELSPLFGGPGPIDKPGDGPVRHQTTRVNQAELLLDALDQLIEQLELVENYIQPGCNNGDRLRQVGGAPWATGKNGSDRMSELGAGKIAATNNSLGRTR